MDRQARTRRTRDRALLLALLVLASWLAGAAHSVAIPHRMCEVHGTIEHGRWAKAAVPASRPLGPALENAGEATHEECSVGPFTRTEILPLPQCAAEVGVCLAPAGRSPLVRFDPIPDPALFLLAPSRSPPVSA